MIINNSLHPYFCREYKKHLLVVSICLALFFALSSESHSAVEAGQVLTVKKKVYMIRDEQRTDAKPQMSLLLKDIVETEKESRTKLFFNDDSILNLGELSRVEVEEYLYSSEKKRSKSIYRLIEGSLKVVVGRSDLEIHTPTAVAAARGTKFIIWAEEIDGSKGTCLMVSDGEVVVKSNRADVKGSVTVTSDKMTCVPAFRPPDPVIFIGASGQEKFARSTSVMGGISENKVRLFEKISLKSPVRRMKALKKMGVDKIPPIIQETKGSLTPVNIELVFPD